MFWSSFNGITKGPSIFWEKKWGTIGSVTYCQYIVPLVHGWITMNPGLQFMQDNAPGHVAVNTTQDFRERGIIMVFWPAYSPDLNRIKTLWN
jgi:ketohexokinase/beta-glucosidase